MCRMLYNNGGTVKQFYWALLVKLNSGTIHSDKMGDIVWVFISRSHKNSSLFDKFSTGLNKTSRGSRERELWRLYLHPSPATELLQLGNLSFAIKCGLLQAPLRKSAVTHKCSKTTGILGRGNTVTTGSTSKHSQLSHR